jgi:hypothetical protein
VRIHERPEASLLGVRAATHGTDLYFAPGMYRPATPEGRRLVGHEVAHVIQQRRGRVANPRAAGAAVVRDPALEGEADGVGRKLVALMRDSTPPARGRAEAPSHVRTRAEAAPPPAGLLPNPVVQCNGIGGELDKLPVDVQQLIVQHLIDQGRASGGKEARNALLALRTVSKGARDLVKGVAEQPRNNPYPNPQVFTAATTGHFPKEFKAKRKKNDVPLKEALPSAWEQYQLGAKEGSDVFVERLDDKDKLFPKGGSTQQQDEREKLVQSGRLFDPKGKWSPQINDAWTLGAIHRGRGVRMLSPPTSDNLWEPKESRPSALGRELVQSLRAGYQPEGGTPDFTSTNPEKRGTLLQPPSLRSYAVIGQAEQGSPKDREDLLKTKL